MAGSTVGFLFRKPSLRTSNGVGTGACIRNIRFIFRIPQSSLGYTGFYKISGIAKLNGIPMYNILVLLFSAVNDTVLLSATWTDINGAFIFDGLAPGKYCVAGHDHTHIYNAVWKVNVAAIPR